VVKDFVKGTRQKAVVSRVQINPPHPPHPSIRKPPIIPPVHVQNRPTAIIDSQALVAAHTTQRSTIHREGSDGNGSGSEAGEVKRKSAFGKSLKKMFGMK